MLKIEKNTISKNYNFGGIGIKEGSLKEMLLIILIMLPVLKHLKISQIKMMYILGWLILQMFASYINYDISSLRPGDDNKIQVSYETIIRIITKFFNKGKMILKK